jgi:hypothetical protein
MSRSGRWLFLGALAAGALFFANLVRLWPLVDFPCHLPASTWRPAALAMLDRPGLAMPGAVLSGRLWVDEPALDHVERSFGPAHAQELIAEGLPVVAERITAKAAGSPDSVTLLCGASGQVLGWDRPLQEDAAGERIAPDAAEALAWRALADAPGGSAGFALTERSASERPHRRDHRLVFERVRAPLPELRERRELVVAGDAVVKSWPTVVVPAAAERAARARQAPVRGLEALGDAGLGIGGLAALAVCLTRLGRGGVRLRPATTWAVVVFALLVVVNVLQQARLFEQWDPLWPRWLAAGRTLVYWSLEDLTTVLPLFVFLAAADALDHDAPVSRGASLWLLGRGQLRDPAVVAASLRGFAVGCLCGGVLAGGVLLLGWLADARVALQPRGFFFHPLNSAAPALTTLCFFAHIALFEELGYRFFAGTWLERLSGRRWLAIAVPALVYGAVHTPFSFLPPADPWWARPLLMAAVGCVWGWAYFRYDALTVVLSHLTADLFIFNWPALDSGQPVLIAGGIATILVPLLPGLLGSVLPRRR